MIGLTALSLLLLGCQADAQCIDTSKKYTTHLGELLNNTDTVQMPVCDGTKLMSRIDGLKGNLTNWPKLPDSLNKYGGYWSFASGVDVLKHFLDLAKSSKGDKTLFIEEAFYYVGFGKGKIDTSGDTKYIITVIDQEAMDDQWGIAAPDPEEKYPYHSFQPLWDDMFAYLENEFQVCHNPGSPDQDTVSRPEDCGHTNAEIPELARINIVSTNYTELTGCKEGFLLTDSDFRYESRETCSERCPGPAYCGDKCQGQYCESLKILQDASYAGSVECVKAFNTKRGSLDETLWSRAFFEQCLGFNEWFTGLGFGYSPAQNQVTGTEFIVRGDIALEDWAFSHMVLREWKET